jgi:hypothetical protein
MKKTLAALIAIAVISTMAVASDTRIASVGAASTFLKDFADIYFLPSNLSLYPRQINAELGSGAPAYYPGYGSAAITWTNDEDQSWGVMGIDVNHAVIGEQEFGADITAINTYLGGPADVLPHPDNKFHLFYARKIGTMTAGLHLARVAGAQTYEDADSTGNTTTMEASTGLWNINAGVSMTPMENVGLDVAFAYQMLSFSGEDSWTNVAPATGSTTIESDGGSNILFGARVFYPFSDALKFVPVFGLNMYSLGFKTSYAGLDTVGNTPEGGKKSRMNLTGAFGLNYQPQENVTLIGGLHFGYGKTTVEDTMGVLYQDPVWFAYAPFSEVAITTLTLPGFSAAVEAELLKWLWVRFGASKMLTKTTGEYTQSPSAWGNELTFETSSTDAPYAFCFGLGLKFGKLSIDAKLNDDQPFDLGYLMSGNTGSPFTQVSATYKF